MASQTKGLAIETRFKPLENEIKTVIRKVHNGGSTISSNSFHCKNQVYYSYLNIYQNLFRKIRYRKLVTRTHIENANLCFGIPLKVQHSQSLDFAQSRNEDHKQEEGSKDVTLAI